MLELAGNWDAPGILFWEVFPPLWWFPSLERCWQRQRGELKSKIFFFFFFVK